MRRQHRVWQVLPLHHGEPRGDAGTSKGKDVRVTKREDLRQGLYWARQVKCGDGKLTKGWQGVFIAGEPPFLYGYTVLFIGDDGYWYPTRSRDDISFRSDEWEFGPRIDVPSDKELAP